MISLPILLPDGFIPLVTVGDQISIDTILAEKKESKDIIVNISHAFFLPPKKVANFVKKNPGDKVSPGDMLAYKKGPLGIKGEYIQSEVSGTVLSYDNESGELHIRLSADHADQASKAAIISPIDGIVSLCNNEKIVIDTERDVIVGLQGNGNTTQGELVVIAGEAQSQGIELHQIDAALSGKIIFSPAFSRDALIKAVGIDVLGIISVSIDPNDYTHLMEKHITTPVIGISAADYDKLLSHHHKTVLVDGLAKSIILL